jgi:hypothetical protein
VILPDTNLLLYAYNALDPRHTQARNWLKALLNGNEQVAFCWPVITGFLRLITNPRIFPNSFEMQEAIEIVDRWLQLPNAVVVDATDRHWHILSRLLVSAQVRAAMTTDAHIAALAIEHGATLHSADKDFARFDGLPIFDPLAI